MNNVQLEQIGIVMIIVGLAGLLGVTGKIVYEDFGINASILAACGMITAIGMIATLIAAGQ